MGLSGTNPPLSGEAIRPTCLQDDRPNEPSLTIFGDAPSGPDARSNRTIRTLASVLVCVMGAVRPLRISRHRPAIGARRRERAAPAIRIVAQRCASVRRAARLADIDSRGPGLDGMALHGG